LTALLRWKARGSNTGTHETQAMSAIRIRVELNKGRIGIPIAKLSTVTEEVKKFLALVGKDANIPHDSKDWLALKFGNSSVIFDCLLAEVEEPRAVEARQIMSAIMSRRQSSNIEALIHPKTRLQYARISEAIDLDEVIGFGIYRDGEAIPEEHYELSRIEGENIAKEITKTCVYHGEVQGSVHAFYKESKKPRMVVRELSSGELVDCFFKTELYAQAVDALTERDGVVFVDGEITEDLIEGKIESVVASDFRPAPLFDLAFFNSFLGSVPNLTGDKSTEDFLSEDD
jgi:hypothetical protein